VKAWQVRRLGSPAEAMELVELPDPVAGPGELLVRVEACALNFPDVLLAAGQYQERPELPFTPGLEVCGTVVGDGRRVIGGPPLPRGVEANALRCLRQFGSGDRAAPRLVR